MAMTKVTTYMVTCDKCENAIGEGTSKDEAAEDARIGGATVSGRKALCKDCQ
jgi:hypothetical protein